MGPFHVVHLGADKLTTCRQRIQQETTGRRGRATDPLYRNRTTLLTRFRFLTDKQRLRLTTLWATDEDYISLQVTWSVYQQIIEAYNTTDRRRGKKLMSTIIDNLKSGVPKRLAELAQLGRTL